MSFPKGAEGAEVVEAERVGAEASNPRHAHTFAVYGKTHPKLAGHIESPFQQQAFLIYMFMFI